MEFEFEKYGVFVIRRGVKVKVDGAELPSGGVIRDDDNGCKFL